MSFDEYAEHIYQKHRLCVSIAVLKTKPPDIPAIQYLEQLKSKMADAFDDDVTICSDDFLMDYDDPDDSVNILNDFDMGDDDEVQKADCDLIGDGSQENNVTEQPTPYFLEEPSQTTSYSTQSQATPSTNYSTGADVTIHERHQNTDHDNIKSNIANSKSTIKNAESNINTVNPKVLGKIDNPNKVPMKKTADTISNIKSVNPKETIAQNIPQSEQIVLKKDTAAKLHRYNTGIHNNTVNNSDNETNFDSQQTVLYTVRGFTQQNTHYSASQAELVIPNKYLHNAEKARERKLEEAIASDGYSHKSEKPIDVKEMNNLSSTVNTQNKELGKTDNKEIEKQVISTLTAKESMPKITSSNILNEDNITQNIDNCLIPNQNGNNVQTNEQNSETVIDADNAKDTQYSQDLDEYFNEIQSYINKERLENLNSQNTLTLQYGNERIQNATQNSVFNESQTPITNFNKDKQINTIGEESTQDFKNLPEENHHDEEFSEHQKEDLEENSLVEEELGSVEIISYKVLGELSKIKTYLRRRGRRMSCDGFSTDSGYKSDSQIRSSNRGSLQLSGISINQSAYSLLNHIVQCPLVEATRDITAEIAQTLGQLINRLHEEETYPPFLEELLDTVDILLRQVYKGAISDYTEILKKDEFLERLLLLNKSIHIQKHTIDKITKMLTKFHETLSDENVTYELTNIDEIENSCYIFHILEILLKKYIKNKSTFSQSNTQLSQDECILKKSAITDIWRRKWNPNLKSNEGSRENRCVLKDCSDILNKIVVDCVNSYSLVAFSALKCFNSMQS